MKLKEIFHPFTNRKNLIISISLLVAGSILILVASLIGISDNLPGILLCFLGVISLVFAFIHHWRKAKSYQVLLIVSAISFVVSVILHNLLEAVGQYFSNSFLLSHFFNLLSVIFFLVAVFICPFTILIGLAGFIIFKYRRQNKKL
jgi:hypothetical protein